MGDFLGSSPSRSFSEAKNLMVTPFVGEEHIDRS